MSTGIIVFIIIAGYMYPGARIAIYNSIYCLDEIHKATEIGKLLDSFETTSRLFGNILKVKKESWFMMLAWSVILSVTTAYFKSYYAIMFFLFSASAYTLYYDAYRQHKVFITSLKSMEDQYEELKKAIDDDKS